MDTMELLTRAVAQGASDIFIITGLHPTFKIQGRMVALGDARLAPSEAEHLIQGIYGLAKGRDLNRVLSSGDDDFSVSVPGLSRFRVNVYKQRGTLASVIRVIHFDLPNPRDIGIPDAVMSLATHQKGLILVTGTAGSGKSTTLACLIDQINRERSSHIITLEDPLEYLHRHQRSIVSQREISGDTESYVTALRAALRQSPDVILLGEMRDNETSSVAMSAAETGHLVLSTMHTLGAANTIARVIDAFPNDQQNQIRTQLSVVLQAVISQQLIPTVDDRIVPAFEILLVDNAIRDMIRESRIAHIDSVVRTSSTEGMTDMDTSLLDLYRKGIIDGRNAVTFSVNPETMLKQVQL